MSPIRKIPWQIPIVFFVLALLLSNRLRGLTSIWIRVGNPSENIAQIIGVVNSKIIVSTENGEVYSLDLLSYPNNMNIANPPWIKENSKIWESEKQYDDFALFSWPPPFHVKQLVQTSYLVHVECVPSIQLGLSQEGDLWFWKYEKGCGLIPGDIYLYCLFPIIGFLLGGLLVGLGLSVSKILAKRKKSPA